MSFGRRSCTKFQSTPPCGGDLSASLCFVSRSYFNPRPLAGATAIGWIAPFFVRLFQSTPPCGGDRGIHEIPGGGIRISIHAPLRGRPGAAGNDPPTKANFNPRPLAGATVYFCSPKEHQSRFQSTPPCGGDLLRRFHSTRTPDFNPRPLAGATSTRLKNTTFRPYFNPRPLAGATRLSSEIQNCRRISIHAPLRGRPGNFNNPCGFDSFQSTPPCGGDRHPSFSDGFQVLISIHAPLRGRPCGGKLEVTEGRISIHAPLRGRPGGACLAFRYIPISIHAPLRGRPRDKGLLLGELMISIHAPLRGRP